MEIQLCTKASEQPWCTEEACSVRHALATKNILGIQQQLASLQEQHVAAQKVMELGVGRCTSFEQQSYTIAREHSHEAGRLEQRIRDLEAIIGSIEDHMGSVRNDVCTQIAKIHEQSLLFADRLILLEIDVSEATLPSRPHSTCTSEAPMQQQDQQQHQLQQQQQHQPPQLQPQLPLFSMPSCSQGETAGRVSL